MAYIDLTLNSGYIEYKCWDGHGTNLIDLQTLSILFVMRCQHNTVFVPGGV